MFDVIYEHFYKEVAQPKYGRLMVRKVEAASAVSEKVSYHG